MVTEEALLSLVDMRRLTASGRAREIRVAAGVSQGELGAAVGVSAACVSLWEAGKRRPRGSAAARYAQILRMLNAEKAA